MTWAGSEDDDGDGHGDEGEGGDGDDVIDDYPRPREWLGQKTLDRVTYKHLFLMVLEAGKSEFITDWLVPGGDSSSWLVDSFLLAVSSEREQILWYFFL